MWSLMVARALAAEPALDVPSEEVVVIAERRVDGAEQAIRGALKERGYLKVLSLGERTWFVNRKLWKPWLMVHDQGFARIRTVPILPIGPSQRLDAPEFPGLVRNADFQMKNQVTLERGRIVGANTATPMLSVITTSRQARKASRGRIARALDPYLRELRDARWELARTERSVELRAELVGIWLDGVAPGGRALPSPADRRAALVARWRATTPGEGGEWARQQIEAYVDDVVQVSDAPFTADEIARANEGSGFDRPFAPLER